MTGKMHLIKKYANGRLYDATDKKYVNMAELGEFVGSGVAFSVVVSKTDQDITDEIVAKLKAEKAKTKPKLVEKPKKKAVAEKKNEISVPEEEDDESPSIIGRLVRKGGGVFSGVPRKSAELWQGAMTMAEEEFDKRVKQLVKGKEISESEAKRLKDEIMGFTDNLKSWLGDNVEERINDVMSMMNLATRDQLDGLAEKIEQLNKKLETLERMETEREDAPEGIDEEKPVE